MSQEFIKPDRLANGKTVINLDLWMYFGADDPRDHVRSNQGGNIDTAEEHSTEYERSRDCEHRLVN